MLASCTSLREVQLDIFMSNIFDADTDTEALQAFLLEGKLLRSPSLERFRDTLIAPTHRECTLRIAFYWLCAQRLSLVRFQWRTRAETSQGTV
jgi:hypothetical protein